MKEVRYARKLIIAMLAIVLAGCAGPGFFGPKVKSESISIYDGAKELYEADKYHEAAQQFRIFTERYPSSPLKEAALFYIGRSYREDGDREEAQKAFRALIDAYKTGIWVDSAEVELQAME